MDVSQAIHYKRAIRNFKDQALPEAAVRAILKAGRRAQSSKNSQPCRYIAIRERATLEALAKCGNWAGHLAGAALGVAILTPDPAEHFQILFDAGQAAAYMQLAALELGVGSCIATIYDELQARQVLDFPQDQHIHFAISFGYPAEPDQLVAPLKKGGRVDFSELVHWEKW